MVKIEEHEGKKYLIVNNYIVYKVLCKIKEIIGTEKFDDTKILINRDDKLSDEIAVVILLICIIKKNGDKFYPQLFLDHASYDE